jgi:hypothetical protein
MTKRRRTDNTMTKRRRIDNTMQQHYGHEWNYPLNIQPFHNILSYMYIMYIFFLLFNAGSLIYIFLVR